MSKPQAETEQFVDLQFPLRGLSITSELQLQPELTTTECVNVRGFEPLTGRGRGGSRPGIAKLFGDTIAGAHLIQHMDVIVDPQAAALLISDDPFNDPFNPDSWEDITDNPIGEPLRNPTYPITGLMRWVRFGGSGYQPNRNVPTRVVPETTTMTVGDDLLAINVLANDSYDGVPVIKITGHQWVPNGTPKTPGTAVHNGSLATLARINYTPPGEGDGGEARVQYRLSTSLTKRATGYTRVIVQPLRVNPETTTVQVGDSALEIDVLANDWWPRNRTPTISDAIQTYTPNGSPTTPGTVEFTGTGADTRLRYTPPVSGDGGTERVDYRMTISGGAGFADGYSIIRVKPAPPWSFVQQVSKFFELDVANVLHSTAFDDPVAEGNLLLAVVVTYIGDDPNETDVSVKNAALTNFTQVGTYARTTITGGSTYATSLWYRVATASAAENTVQVRADFLAFVGVAMLEYHHATSTDLVLDVSNTASLALDDYPDPPQTISAGAVTPAVGDSLVIMVSGGATNNDASANAGFAERVMVESGFDPDAIFVPDVPIAIYAIDKLASSGSTAPTVDAASPTNQYGAIVAAFKGTS